MPVTLIGYRGSGKSCVGKLLAERLACPFVDADEEVERRAGKSIQQIFDDAGEPEFRRLERDVMSELLAQDRSVIAAGGGAVLDERTRTDLRDAGPVVWLRADVETLSARIAVDPSTASRRPNLTDSPGREEIERLLAQRTPLYQTCATLIVDTEDRKPQEIIRQILAGIAGPKSPPEEDGGTST